MELGRCDESGTRIRVGSRVNNFAINDISRDR